MVCFGNQCFIGDIKVIVSCQELDTGVWSLSNEKEWVLVEARVLSHKNQHNRYSGQNPIMLSSPKWPTASRSFCMSPIISSIRSISLVNNEQGMFLAALPYLGKKLNWHKSYIFITPIDYYFYFKARQMSTLPPCQILSIMILNNLYFCFVESRTDKCWTSTWFSCV